MVHFEHHNKSETEVVSLAGEGGVKVMDEYYPMKSLNFFLHEIVHHFLVSSGGFPFSFPPSILARFL